MESPKSPKFSFSRVDISSEPPRDAGDPFAVARTGQGAGGGGSLVGGVTSPSPHWKRVARQRSGESSLSMGSEKAPNDKDNVASGSSSLSVSRRLTTTLAFLQAGRESERTGLARDVTRLLQERQRLARLHRKTEMAVLRLLDRRRARGSEEPSLLVDEEDEGIAVQGEVSFEHTVGLMTGRSEGRGMSRDEELADAKKNDASTSHLASFIGSQIMASMKSSSSHEDGGSQLSTQLTEPSHMARAVMSHGESGVGDGSDWQSRTDAARSALKAADEETAAQELSYRLLLTEEDLGERAAMEAMSAIESKVLETEETLAKKTMYLLPKGHQGKEEVEALLKRHCQVEQQLLTARKVSIALQMREQREKEKSQKRFDDQRKVPKTRLVQAALELTALQHGCQQQEALLTRLTEGVRQSNTNRRRAQEAEQRLLRAREGAIRERDALQEEVKQRRAELLKTSVQDKNAPCVGDNGGTSRKGIINTSSGSRLHSAICQSLQAKHTFEQALAKLEAHDNSTHKSVIRAK